MNLPFNTPSLGSPLSLFESLDSSLVRASLILLLLFFFALFIGLSRRFMVSTHLHGLWTGMGIGIIAILALEAAIFWFYKEITVGTRFSSLPPNLKIVFEDSQKNITRVLGAQNEQNKQPTARDVVLQYKQLSPIDAELIKNSICREK